MNTIRDDSNINTALAELRDFHCEPDWGAMEERLTHAFAIQATVPLRRAGAQRWQWAAAAAIVFLAAAITFYLPSSRYGVAMPKPATGEPAPVKTEAPPRREPAHETPPAVPVAPKASPRATRTTSRQWTGPTHQAAGPTYTDFVVLPAASGLPAFESGRIVRMEVPLTMLPAYGLELVADATPSSVQAEFLIGQDGVARAIRLASNSQQ
jgi:hypothetical protein